MTDKNAHTITYDMAKENAEESHSYNLVRHVFKGIIRATEKAYLFELVDNNTHALWVPKSMTMGMQIDPISKRITVYIPDFCNSKEVSFNEV